MSAPWPELVPTRRCYLSVVSTTPQDAYPILQHPQAPRTRLGVRSPPSRARQESSTLSGSGRSIGASSPAGASSFGVLLLLLLLLLLLPASCSSG